MQQQLPSLLDPPITFGHRGARAHVRENTLESFAHGLALGSTGLESDVWLTADRVPVLDHDGQVKVGRLGRSRRIADMRRDELPSYIPTLAELYEHCGTGYQLSLDLKDPASGQPVIDVTADAAPQMVPNLWLCSPTVDVLMPLRGQGAKLVDSTRLGLIKEGPERRAADLYQSGIDCLNMHHTDWNGGLVALLHRFGRYAFGWDMQEPRILIAGLRMGLDGVYSDWPERMVAALQPLPVAGRPDHDKGPTE